MEEDTHNWLPISELSQDIIGKHVWLYENLGSRFEKCVEYIDKNNIEYIATNKYISHFQIIPEPCDPQSN